jgi:hypothetical protein
MIDKSNIKTSDWLTRGMSEEQLQKEKEKAIKQADRELARIEKKEKKKSIRAYRKMYKRHRKEMIKLAKEDRDFDWGWLDDFVIMKIKHMYEYFSAGNNVWQTDETRLPIIEQLKHVIDLYEELNNVWVTDTKYEKELSDVERFRWKYYREETLYRDIYSYIGVNLRAWWD